MSKPDDIFKQHTWYAKDILNYVSNYEHTKEQGKALTHILLASERKPSSNMYSDEENDYDLPEDESMAYYYYTFACFVEGADIELLGKAIADMQDPEYIYRFARDIEGANITLLEDALIECYFPWTNYIYMFARDVKGANVKKLQKYMECADAEEIYSFIEDIPGASAKLMQKFLLTEIPERFNQDFAKYAYAFADEIKGANIGKIIEAVKNVLSKYNYGSPFEYELKVLLADLKELKKRKAEIKSKTKKRTLDTH